MFTDLGGDAWQDVPEPVKAEVLTRTPGFSGWQQEQWQAHCRDAMEFLGRVGHAELQALGDDAVAALREELSSWGWDNRQIDEFMSVLDRDHSPTGYAFRCRHCGTFHVYADFTEQVPGRRRRMRIPFDEPVPQRELSTPDQPVWAIEVLPVQPGQVIRVAFLGKNSALRQGLWFGTEGAFIANDVVASQLVLWEDTAPPQVDITMQESDGLLRIYNVWASGRSGRGEMESLTGTSGMVKEDRGHGTYVYGCHDFGPNPDFTTLTFSLTLL